MRLSTLRACIVTTVALTLAACSGMGMPSSTGGSVGQPPVAAPAQQAEPGAPMQQDETSAPTPDGAPVSVAKGALPDLLQPLAVTTCATSPPQYQWIFKGACEKITLKPSGATFSLQKWHNITVTGSIGANNVKPSATVYLADATDSKGDIETYKGKAFDKYNAEGTTIVYAVAVNQSKTAIKPVPQKNKPILQYVITDAKPFPGSSCGAAVLTTGEKGSLEWATLPGGPFKVKGKTVTITQYSVPRGFNLPPQEPLYFAVNCFN